MLAADRIYVLQRGRVVGSGTHEELMAVDGPYRELYLAQAGAYLNAGPRAPKGRGELRDQPRRTRA